MVQGPGNFVVIDYAGLVSVSTALNFGNDRWHFVTVYLSLMDWGSRNVLAVALAELVYLWLADTGGIEQLCETELADDTISSVSFINGGRYLAVGTNSNQVQIWDVERMS